MSKSHVLSSFDSEPLSLEEASLFPPFPTSAACSDLALNPQLFTVFPLDFLIGLEGPHPCTVSPSPRPLPAPIHSLMNLVMAFFF